MREGGAQGGEEAQFAVTAAGPLEQAAQPGEDRGGGQRREHPGHGRPADQPGQQGRQRQPHEQAEDLHGVHAPRDVGALAVGAEHLGQQRQVPGAHGGGEALPQDEHHHEVHEQRDRLIGAAERRAEQQPEQQQAGQSPEPHVRDAAAPAAAGAVAQEADQGVVGRVVQREEGHGGRGPGGIELQVVHVVQQQEAGGLRGDGQPEIHDGVAPALRDGGIGRQLRAGCVGQRRVGDGRGGHA